MWKLRLRITVLRYARMGIKTVDPGPHLPGAETTRFPEDYLTKVPARVRHREAAARDEYPREPATLKKAFPAKFVLHQREYLYFDYGAVRFGRKPWTEVPDLGKIVCVGYGWLPNACFVIDEDGKPDLVTPTNAERYQCPYNPHLAKARGTPFNAMGCLGLLYKLDTTQTPRSVGDRYYGMVHSTSHPKVKCANQAMWDKAVHFSPFVKLSQKAWVYIHVFDGGVGHLLLDHGGTIRFRNPEWPVKAVIHVNPTTRLRDRSFMLTPVGQTHIQGKWMVSALLQWIKDAKLPPEYVKAVLMRWIPPGARIKFTDRKAVRLLCKLIGCHGNSELRTRRH